MRALGITRFQSQQHIALTAFRTPDGALYQWNCLSFGLCNAPASFQRAMDSVFAEYTWDFIFVYLDDIVVFSRTFDEHLSHLRKCLDLARTAGLKFKISKCFFAKNKLRYLGHVISDEGVQPDPENTDKVKNFPVPTTKSQVKSFVGLASYYRRFVPNLRKLPHP